MAFTFSSASEANSASDEVAANCGSDTFNELNDFLRLHASFQVQGGSTGAYQFLDRFTDHKYHFDNESMVQFFELLNACRREQCILHMLERVSDEPAGLMLDIDRLQDSPAPSIFDSDHIRLCITVLANIVSQILADPHVERNIDVIATASRDRLLSRTGDNGKAPEGDATHSQGTSSSERRVYHIFVIKRSKITFDIKHAAYKDGIHLLIPELWFSKPIRKFIVSRFREEIHSIFAELPAQVAEKMVDANSASVSVHLLGSCKRGGTLYNLSAAACVTYYQGGVLSGGNTVVPLSVEALCDGYDKPPKEGGVKINLTYELCLTQWMPTFRGQPTWLHKETVQLPNERKNAVEAIFANVDTEHLAETQARAFDDQIQQLIGSDPDAAFICELLIALPITYAQEYDKWRNVLMAIADTAVTTRHDEYKLLAQQFSMRAPDKWNQSGFESLWTTLYRRSVERTAHDGRPSITLRSLEFWVRAENPEAYQNARHHNARAFLMKDVFENSGSLDHVTIAEILFRRLRGLYVIDTDAPDRSLSSDWYEFVLDTSKDIRPGEIYKWRRSRIPHDIYRMIPTQIRALCADVKRDVTRRMETAPDDQKPRYAGIIRNLTKSMKSLGQNGFIEGAISQVEHLLDIHGFVESLDKNPYVLGVGNGVLELFNPEDIERMRDARNSAQRAIAATRVAASSAAAASSSSASSSEPFVPRPPRLIRGYHELRVSKFTEVDYEPFDPNNPYVRDILQAYRDIYVESDVCEFFLFYLSTWIDSCDVQRILPLLGGGGSNGKTWSVYFPQTVLGSKYVKVLKMQLLTDEREKAHEANSALMQLKDTRGGYFDEANEGEELNPARVKTIVTPGEQNAREVYGRAEQFRNTAKCVAISNYDFIINATDNGTWDRILFYQCKTRFVLNPDPASPFERLKRVELTRDWPNNMNYRRAMLSILVHYRVRLEREYGGEIIHIPHPTIVAETNAFRIKQDPISRFIVERMAKSPTRTTSVHEIVDAYNHWYREIMNTRPKIVNTETMFQNSRIGEYIGRAPNGSLVATGLRLRDRNDRLQEDESIFE